MRYNSTKGRVLLACHDGRANSTEIANVLKLDVALVRQAISKLRKDGYVMPNESQGAPVRLTSVGEAKVGEFKGLLDSKVNSLRTQIAQSLHFGNPFYYHNPYATTEQ